MHQKHKKPATLQDHDNLPHHHVLFVDDEPPVRETLSMFFRVKGVKVTAVSTGAEAMQLADHTRFTAAIFDLHLHQENGIQLLERFKKRHPAIPVVMFTAFADDREKMNTAIAKGASAFFSKGESMSVLLDGVMNVINKPQTN